jgi:hypothetical protein
LTLDDGPGSYEICPVCFWEDDLVQLRWPDYTGGANKPSLIEAQVNFANTGVVEPRLVHLVRGPLPNEPLDAGWRPIDRAVDAFEPNEVSDAPWPEPRTALYWWRPTYWRRT